MKDIIFDTDFGADCDDVMALAYLIYAEKYLDTRIKAITFSNGNTDGIAAIRAFVRDVGREPIPVGAPARSVPAYDAYCRQLAELFGDASDREPAENAVSVLRRALADSNGAVICAVGASTNIAALLESGADEISPLDGVSLVRENCEKLVLMAGRFDGYVERAEWNVLLDVKAAQTIVRLCAVPLVFLPFETGMNIMTGGPIMKKYGDTTPLSMAFELFPGVKDKGARPSWDPATAVYCVEGCREFFEESKPCIVNIADDGITTTVECDGGLHRVLTKAKDVSNEDIAAYVDECAIKIYEGR